MPAVFSRQWSPAATSATPHLVFSPEPAPDSHRRIEAPEQFNRDSAWCSTQPAGLYPVDTLWPETGMAS